MRLCSNRIAHQHWQVITYLMLHAWHNASSTDTVSHVLVAGFQLYSYETKDVLSLPLISFDSKATCYIFKLLWPTVAWDKHLFICSNSQHFTQCNVSQKVLKMYWDNFRIFCFICPLISSAVCVAVRGWPWCSG